MTDIYRDDVPTFWAYADSDDAESWYRGGATRDGAEAALLDDYEDGGAVCEAREIDVAKVVVLAVDLGDILERMEESQDEFGIFDSPVFEVDDDGEYELHDLLRAWATKHVSLVRGRWLCTGAPIAVLPPKPRS